MSSNADSIVAQIQQDMQALMIYVTGPQTATQTADTIELTLFRPCWRSEPPCCACFLSRVPPCAPLPQRRRTVRC